MAYDFSGFFARADEAVIEAARERWTECEGRVITVPFQGIGVTSPKLDYWKYAFLGDQEAEARGLNPVQTDLCEFSRTCPGTVFVFVCAECWGGDCQYEGFVCKDGRVTRQEKGRGALRRLIACLDVRLDDREDFEPFERGYFSQT